MITHDDPNIPMALERFANMCRITPSMFTPRDTADQPLAAIEFDDLYGWLAEAQGHLAAWLVVTAGFVAASRQLVDERFEGAEPDEFVNAVLRMMTSRFGPPDM